jgi:hypothetical protein
VDEAGGRTSGGAAEAAGGAVGEAGGRTSGGAAEAAGGAVGEAGGRTSGGAAVAADGWLARLRVTIVLGGAVVNSCTFRRRFFTTFLSGITSSMFKLVKKAAISALFFSRCLSYCVFAFSCASWTDAGGRPLLPLGFANIFACFF